MTPAMLGEYCARCGAKCTTDTELTPQGDREVKVYRCPNGHGIQLITELPGSAPEGPPTETGILQWDLAATDADVPLTSPPTTVIVGSEFLIDSEYMVVTDVSNLDNPAVTRGAHGTTAVAHTAGTEVLIWGTP